ncbi:flagellar hook-associated protein FlgL [Rhizobacter sp. Root404]|uniref:flagellar hook-associated protein FlgL n=1 Tax=Rhizobacter sp. Root404 TaxID=1736528 RepID=UPI00070019C2|nr:flagellar hook-associated protein FlgL [Rhizobacter sp. Root404]KQW40587.1 flagellar hook protein [Rhizobacter sp. Root404]
MRISTTNSYNTSLDSLMDRQSRLAETQEQMTTGKRVNRASDDPAAAARAERALASERRSVASQRAVDASDNAMRLTEGALGDAGDLLQTAREALVSAGNPTFSDKERLGVANQLADLRAQLLAVANRTDSAGIHLFGGQGASQAPFTDLPGGVQFQGASGQTQAASSDALPLTIDGESTWMQARNGNGVFVARAVTSTGSAWIGSGNVIDPSALTGSTYSLQFSVSGASTTYSVLKDGLPTAQTNVAYSSGQAIQVDGMSTKITGQPADGDAFQLAPSNSNLSVFDALDKAIAELKTPGRTGTQIAQSNVENLSNIDAVMGQVAAGRSQVGATMNRVDAVTERLSALKLSSQTERAHAEDLDMTQAISDFSNQQTGYDAALKAYSMVQRLSLFNYLNT